MKNGWCILGLLPLLGCHEVLGVEQPPLPGASSMLLLEYGTEDEARLRADSTREPSPVPWVVREQTELYAVGFACELDRLGLKPGTLEALPTLPPPVALARWTASAGWTSAPDAVPGELGARLAAPDACVGLSGPASAEVGPAVVAAREPEQFGSPWVDVARLDDGRFFVLQELAARSEDGGFDQERSDARYLLVDGPARIATPIAGSESWPKGSFVRRGSGFVLAGAEGVFEGHPSTGFTQRFPALPHLEGEVAIRIAVTPEGQPLELLTLSRNRFPLPDTRSSTVTLARVSADGTEVLGRNPRRLRGYELEQLAVSHLGEHGWLALGFERDRRLLTWVNGSQVQSLAPNPNLAGEPRGWVSEPGVGVVMSDHDGQSFMLASGEDPALPWPRVAAAEGDREPVALAEVGAHRVVLLYNDLAGGSLRVVVSEPGGAACVVAERLPVVPVDDNLVEAGLLRGARFEAGAWWLFSAFDQFLQASRLELPEDFGACSVASSSR